MWLTDVWTLGYVHRQDVQVGWLSIEKLLAISEELSRVLCFLTNDRRGRPFYKSLIAAPSLAMSPALE